MVMILGLFLTVSCYNGLSRGLISIFMLVIPSGTSQTPIMGTVEAVEP
jgi:hypothetical protein